MIPEVLIALSKRKNAAYSALINARAKLRKPAGYNKMTERDRDIDMELAVIKQREEYDNLRDEYSIWYGELYPLAITHGSETV